MSRFATKYSWRFLGLAAFLLAGAASAGGSEDRPARVVFAGHPQVLVAELRQGVLAELRGDFIAAAKSEMVEVLGRVEEQQAEWRVAARLEGE